MTKKNLLFHIMTFLSLFALNASDYCFEGITFINAIESIFLFDNGIFYHYEHYIDDNENDIIINTKEKYELIEDNDYLLARINNNQRVYDIYIFSADAMHMVLYNCCNKEQILLTKKTSRIDESWIWPISNFSNTACFEGKYGNGIGEKISCDISGSRKLYIINGYFSGDEPQMFKEYGRVKTFQIDCRDEKNNLIDSFERTMQDSGKMQLIHFEKRYSKIDLIIKDTYPGNKNNEVAITGIFIDGLDIYN